MRILHLDSGLEWRGGQQQIVYLASGLMLIPGVEQSFVLPPTARLRTEIEKLGLKCHPLSLRSEADPVALSTLSLIMRNVKPDLIHAHDSRTLGLAAILRAVGRARRVVAHRRVAFPIKKNSFSKWKYHRVPACLISVSYHIRDLLLEYGIVPERIKVVYDSTEIPGSLSEADRVQALKQWGLDKNAFVVGCVGHFTEEKGHEDLIKGFFRIQTLYPEARLLLIGDGPLRGKYRDLIAELDLKEKVGLPGMVPDLKDAFAAMDVFVLPSVSEGLGSVLLKAMACGVPVMASRVGGIPELIENGVTGYLFSPGDPIALADCVLSGISHENLVRRCAERAAQRVESEFSVTRMAGETHQIYSNVLDL